MPGASLTIHLTEAELAALDRHIHERRFGLTREQMVSEIVAAWAATQPGALLPPVDEGMRPEELNASNDM
ncbi:MAG TPA: hypothetical protein VIU82_10540 [Bosea sp. (in: a-proteobacteria)]